MQKVIIFVLLFRYSRRSGTVTEIGNDNYWNQLTRQTHSYNTTVKVNQTTVTRKPINQNPKTGNESLKNTCETMKDKLWRQILWIK